MPNAQRLGLTFKHYPQTNLISACPPTSNPQDVASRTIHRSASHQKFGLKYSHQNEPAKEALNRRCVECYLNLKQPGNAASTVI